MRRFRGSVLRAQVLLALAGTAVVAAPARATEFPAFFNLAILDGSTGFRLDGVATNNQVGDAISAAGDVNGDGYGDLIVGSLRASSYDGSAYVVLGKAGGFSPVMALSLLDGTNGFRLAGSTNGDFVGRSVAAAGDINGDGIDDLIVGADAADSNGSNAGSSYVVFGKTGAFTSVVDLLALDGTTGFRLDGVAGNDGSGFSTAAAGDVNGDGFADLLVGAHGADPNGAYSGSSYVIFGKGSFSSAVNLSSLNGSTGFRLDGSASYDFAGYSVSSAGDVNGDGFADVIVGAYRADPNGNESGASYVVFGKASSFASSLSLSALNGTTGFRIEGAAIGEELGLPVASAGDVNGDGFADLIVGANLADRNGTNSGSSYVVFGKAAGFSSAVNVSTLDGLSGFRLDGVAAYDKSGRAVASPGDVNGDGFADVIIGALRADPPSGTDAGSSYVVFGKPSFAGNAAVSLSALTGANGFRMNGIASDDFAGSAVATAGDLNGDGLSDFLVGADGADPNAHSQAGSVFVVFGRAPAEGVIRTGSAARQTINGSPFADVLVAMGDNDTLEGRDGGDWLVGRAGKTTASYLHSPSLVTANLGASYANTGEAAGDYFDSIENLVGSAYDDSLTGNSSDNRITGGKGRDTLKGAGGKDIFDYDDVAESPPGAVADQIKDFRPGNSNSTDDKIDVATIDAKASSAGNQSFKFIGTKGFTAEGQVRIKKSGSDIIVQGNTSGTSGAEFEIILKGLSDTSDFSDKDFRL